jgi:large exoprotein involved in heme utilization and adhesion
LLTVSVPIGLGFGSNPGDIRVQGTGQGIRKSAAPIDTNFGLRVQPPQTLALVGGDVALEGGTLKTAGGRIELGSVTSPSLVSLNSTEKSFSLSYESVPTFGNIQLSQQAAVDASGVGGGDIQVRGRQLTLIDGSRIESSTLGAQPGGTLSITASDSVELKGRTADKQLGSRLVAQVYSGASGLGSDLIIRTGRLVVRDGSEIFGGTLGTGNAGSLALRASDSVELIGTTPQEASAILTSVAPGATGKGGNLTIETRRLTVRDGAQIFAGTQGEGAAGTLTVSADDSIQLIGTAPQRSFLGSALSTSVEPGATGSGGNLTINTGQLNLRNGAVVSSATFGEGVGGSLVILARKVNLIGTSSNNQFPSRISARTTGTQKAGNMSIKTGQLIVRDGAEVTVKSRGTGKAGNLEVDARSLHLDNNASITATTRSGNGGDVKLQVQDSLSMRRNSRISTTAGTAETVGDGGDISINTAVLAALENSDITANAFQGRGGNIQIATQGLFLSPDSNITASSQFGVDGLVDIRVLGFDAQNAITPQSPNLISTEQVMAGSCLARRNVEQGTFVVTGSGGLPISPFSDISEWESLSGVQPEEDESIQGLQPSNIEQKVASVQPEWKKGDPIVEAQGIIVTADGRTLLGLKPQQVEPFSPQALSCGS